MALFNAASGTGRAVGPHGRAIARQPPGGSANNKKGTRMEAIDCMLTRRSCRSFNDTPVPAETVDKIVEAGRFAANGMGKQAVTFVVVTDPETVAQLSAMNAKIMGTGIDPFYGGKTVVVVLADAEAHTCVEDGSLAMGNLMNAAHALGVESIWIHRAQEEFESEEGRAFLAKWGLPADGSLRGVGHCVLGYSDKPAADPKPRRENVVYVK